MKERILGNSNIPLSILFVFLVNVTRVFALRFRRKAFAIKKKLPSTIRFHTFFDKKTSYRIKLFSDYSRIYRLIENYQREAIDNKTKLICTNDVEVNRVLQ